jgi:hypothetical protein
LFNESTGIYSSFHEPSTNYYGRLHAQSKSLHEGLSIDAILESGFYRTSVKNDGTMAAAGQYPELLPGYKYGVLLSIARTDAFCV